MTCEKSISLSETEEFDSDLVFLDSRVQLSKKELRRRHIQRLVMQGSVYINDLPDDPCARCGYFFLNTDYFFPGGDPMTPACVLHDSLYDRELNGGISRKTADRIFLKAMLNIANGNKLLTAQAYTYYGIVRLFGGFVW